MYRLTFKFSGKCRLHEKYNPRTDGPPSGKNKECEVCDHLYVVYLYVEKIASKRASHFPGFRLEKGGKAQEAEIAQIPSA